MVDFASLVSNAQDSIKSILGEDVIFEPRAGGSFPIRGVFNERFEEVDVQTSQLVSSQKPNCGIKRSDIDRDPKKHDFMVIRGKRYVIEDCQEDGEGWLELLLFEAD